MKVKATTVTIGTDAQPRSLTSVSGNANKYRVTHCFRWIPSTRSAERRRYERPIDERTRNGDWGIGNSFHCCQLLDEPLNSADGLERLMAWGKE